MIILQKTKSERSTGYRCAAHTHIKIFAALIFCILAFPMNVNAEKKPVAYPVRLLITPVDMGSPCFMDQSFEFKYYGERIEIYSAHQPQVLIFTDKTNREILDDCINNILLDRTKFEKTALSELWSLSLFIRKDTIINHRPLEAVLADSDCRRLLEKLCMLSPLVPNLCSDKQCGENPIGLYVTIPSKLTFSHWDEVKLCIDNGGGYDALFLSEDYWKEELTQDGYRSYMVTPDSLIVSDMRKMIRRKRKLSDYEKTFVNRLIAGIDRNLVYSKSEFISELDCVRFSIDGRPILLMSPLVDMSYIPNTNYKALYDFIKNKGDALNPIGTQPEKIEKDLR